MRVTLHARVKSSRNDKGKINIKDEKVSHIEVKFNEDYTMDDLRSDLYEKQSLLVREMSMVKGAVHQTPVLACIECDKLDQPLPNNPMIA